MKQKAATLSSCAHILNALGSSTLRLYRNAKRFILFLFHACYTCMSHPFKKQIFLEQIEHIGINSINIVVLTGTFTGMVFALQSYDGFSRIGGEQFIGSVVALAVARELGPVLTGLMVTGRICSAIAAELGTMRISEQIDALTTLRINPFSYLIVPRICAGTLILPCLTIFSTICGVIGGYLVVSIILGLNSDQYLANIVQFCTFFDIVGGIIKAGFFGLILTWVGCYKGYYTHGGAEGVGRATTEAVVLSSTLILITNYFLTQCLSNT
jgi:phospholipid/cholesterol/gamma-HCH transport system permease protein